MTRREVRVQRLAELRRLQHDAAAMTLRTSRGLLHAAEAAHEAERHSAAVSRGQMGVALQAGNRDAWLLQCSDTAWSNLATARCIRERDAAKKAVGEAVARETEARRESMQMQACLERLQQTTVQESARAEQRWLDEAVRLAQHARSHSPLRRIS
jgi:hypothetical protein